MEYIAMEATAKASVKALVKESDPLTDTQHVPELLKEMRLEFDKLAGDKKHVTAKQLGSLLESPHVSGADAAVAAALYKVSLDLGKGEFTVAAKERSGLSSEQLSDFANKVSAAPSDCLSSGNQSNVNIPDPDVWTETQFALAHRTKSDRIMRTDIDHSLATTIGDAATRQSLNFFAAHYSEICRDAGHSVESGASFSDLTKFASKYKNTCMPLWDMRGVLSFHNKVVSEGIPRALYSNGGEPLKAINHKGIEQGLAGDCYFEGPLGATADNHKETIMQMITANKDQTFTVIFPDSSAKYIVSKPTEAERIIYNKGATQGDWATVSEKAFGLWFHDKLRKGAVQSKWEVPEEYLSHPDQNVIPMRVLSGGKAARNTVLDNTTEDQLRESLVNDFAKHKSVVASRQLGNFAHDELVDLPTGHVYQVVGFDARSPAEGQVSIRNPWGQVGTTYGGDFVMSLQNFKKSFYDLTEEK